MQSDQLTHLHGAAPHRLSGPEPVSEVEWFFRASVLRCTAIALALMLIVSGCRPASETSGESDLALIAGPAAGDIYAAELTYFSEASFEDEAMVFGLMKVLAVDETKVTFVTENAASASDAVPREEILGDMLHIEFDEREQIEISRGQLLEAHAAGKIFAMRR